MAKAHKRPPRRRQGARIKDPVPVAPLREYYLRGIEQGEFSVCSIAEELGWYRGMVRAGGRSTRMKLGLDTTRVQRMLGVRGYSPGTKPNGKKYGSGVRTHLNYDSAVLLCRAMGAAPVDMLDPETGEPIL